MPRAKSAPATSHPVAHEGRATLSRRQMLERVALGAAAGWVSSPGDMCEEMPLRVKVGGSVLSATLSADSFHTLVVPPA